ncbi:hypothetical protein BDN72DRAFT_960012 [Pluteus cervinus]|uniref:Uncharacterized protein n=1 Tax=Pluteus cervinus TaxID=181527 RepID=A0ACD3ATD7_9AGAR|nr:hypothetical protein BDN72DRAFT_960012 [Pluteus cervinus]
MSLILHTGLNFASAQGFVQSPPPDMNTLREIGAGLLRVVAAAAGTTPILGQVARSVVRLAEVVESMRANRAKFKAIARDVAMVAGSLSSFKLGLPSEETPDTAGYAQALFAFNEVLEEIYTFAVQCINCRWWKRFVRHKSDKEAIQSFRERLDFTARWFQSAQGHAIYMLALSTHERVKKLEPDPTER